MAMDGCTMEDGWVVDGDWSYLDGSETGSEKEKKQKRRESGVMARVEKVQ